MQKKFSFGIFIFNGKVSSFVDGNLFPNVQFQITPGTWSEGV